MKCAVLTCAFLADESAKIEIVEIEGLTLSGPAEAFLCGLHLHYAETGELEKFGIVPVAEVLPARPAAAVDSRSRYVPPRRG